MEKNKGRNAATQERLDLSIEEIFAHIPGHVYIKDREGHLLAINDKAFWESKLVAAAKGQSLLGKRDEDFLWKNDAKAFRQNEHLAIENGRAMTFLEQTQFDGKTYLFHTIKAPLKDKKGNVIGTIGTSIEVTDLKGKLGNMDKPIVGYPKSILDPTEKNKKSIVQPNLGITLEEIFASIPSYIFLKDRNGHYLAANDRPGANEQMVKGKSLIGKTDEDLPWKDNAKAIHQHDHEVMEKGKSMAYVEPAKLADGKMHLIYTVKAPLRDHQGQIIGVIGKAIDLSELKGKL